MKVSIYIYRTFKALHSITFGNRKSGKYWRVISGNNLMGLGNSQEQFGYIFYPKYINRK